jgi:trk system potassium uptake protein
MQTIIVGCGRVGSTLALQLVAAGQDVCVVDRKSESLRRLGEGFSGRTVVGVGFDKEVLTKAGVNSESRVAAVTSGDNSNILIARVARELFGAAKVVARIYDPQRAAIYERLGIHTVASVAWTVSQVEADLFPDAQAAVWTDPTSHIALREFLVPAPLAGTAVSAFEKSTGSRIISVTRLATATIAQPSMLLQQDDLLHVAAAKDADFSHVGQSNEAGH